MSDCVDLRVGDCLEVLRAIPSESVHCCVTSPPYFGLRDYGHPGQIGLEPTPEEYVAKLLEVFREVRRVLRHDGTMWLNLGDSYNAYNGGAGPGSKLSKRQSEARPQLSTGYGLQVKSLKPKDLMGVPWMVAFALRADGWYLRQDIVWHKPAPMPESVQDRCTKAHEYLFLLTKSPRYYFDAVAIREKAVTNDNRRPYGSPGANAMDPRGHQGMGKPRESAPKGSFNGKTEVMAETGQNAFRAVTDTRNRRSVWTIASQPYKGAHFATFPPKLVEPCILAGTSEMGCCPHCGTPWERFAETKKLKRERPNDTTKRTGESGTGNHCPNTVAGVEVTTIAWVPQCKCPHDEPVPCTVLDPFAGSGTTLAVALKHGRRAIGIELNEQYAELARERVAETQAELEWEAKNVTPSLFGGVA